MALVSTKDIEKGEEILLSYGTGYTDNSGKPVPCFCTQPLSKCSGYVANDGERINDRFLELEKASWKKEHVLKMADASEDDRRDETQENPVPEKGNEDRDSASAFGDVDSGSGSEEGNDAETNPENPRKLLIAFAKTNLCQMQIRSEASSANEGVRLYKCSVCNKRSSGGWKQHVLRHLRTRHPGETGVPVLVEDYEEFKRLEIFSRGKPPKP